MKELSLKRALLLALASAKHIGDLHAFSMDSDCIRFGPGGCSVTLRPRPGYVPNHYLPTSESRLFCCLPCLLSHRLHTMRMLRFGTPIWVCLIRALRIYIDRSASFRQSTNFSCATVVVRRAGSYQNRGFPTGLWTLWWLLIRAKVWNAPFTLGTPHITSHHFLL